MNNTSMNNTSMNNGYFAESQNISVKIHLLCQPRFQALLNEKIAWEQGYSYDQLVAVNTQNTDKLI